MTSDNSSFIAAPTWVLPTLALTVGRDLNHPDVSASRGASSPSTKLLLLLVFAWPLALLELVPYSPVWLVSLPFPLLGISVRGLFDLLDAIIRLPARVLRGKPLG